jgi:hypothetical protein
MVVILRLICLKSALLAFFVRHLMDMDERGARVIVIITNVFVHIESGVGRPSLALS